MTSCFLSLSHTHTLSLSLSPPLPLSLPHPMAIFYVTQHSPADTWIFHTLDINFPNNAWALKDKVLNIENRRVYSLL